MAIGDAPNDREMLRLAGLGVAVSNAAPELRAVADETVCSNEEHGVKMCLERFFETWKRTGVPVLWYAVLLDSGSAADHPAGEPDGPHQLQDAEKHANGQQNIAQTGKPSDQRERAVEYVA